MTIPCPVCNKEFDNKYQKRCSRYCYGQWLKSNSAQITHGMSGTNVYRRWKHMLARCTNPKNKHYKNYGGRGIKVCERWRKFENFLADMGYPPTWKHSLDRIDNNGNYEPSNCRWATRLEQQNNIRSNKMLEFKGKRMSLSAWSRELNINKATLAGRLNKRKWSIEKAFLTPIGRWPI